MEIKRFFGDNLLTEQDDPNQFCLFDQDTSNSFHNQHEKKIWTLDSFKTFIFADMTLLGSKVGKGGLEWPINKSLQWKEINI